MTLDEIKNAVDEGKTVCWKHDGYQVRQWKDGRYYVVFLGNNHAVGLDYDGKLQGNEEDFFILGEKP